MNNVNLIGNLTDDAKIYSTSGNDPKTYARFTLAVKDGYGDNEKTNFIQCSAWGKTAENLERFTGKGDKISVSGKIETGSYEKDGRTIYTTTINARMIEYLRTKEGKK